jgi:Ran GTPase-activating protein (RanGAP) involved in mRNA processing and transport
MKKTYQIGIDSDIDRIIAEINEHPEISVQLDISIESSGFQIDPVAAANGQPFVTIQSNTNDIENIITSKLLPCIQRILSETGLVELSLCHLGLTSENIKSIFSGQENSTIKYLNLENNCLGYSGVNFLAECLINYKSLETLVIGGNVGFKGAESLAKFLTQTTSLKVLNLESIMNNKGIGDEGLGYIIQALNGNESLEELNCGFNQISFEHDSLLELSSYKNIKVFTLGSNIISRNGLFKLCDVLKSNSKIETLSLINNPLNDDGAELIAQFLQDNKSLKSLDIRSTRIGDTGISCIAKALPIAQNLQGFYI